MKKTYDQREDLHAARQSAAALPHTVVSTDAPTEIWIVARNGMAVREVGAVMTRMEAEARLRRDWGEYVVGPYRLAPASESKDP